MRIGLINEASQSHTNSTVFETLNRIAKKYGHEVRNYGMYSPDDEVKMNSLHNGLLSAILLNTDAVDLVVTGCGNGEGVTVALNAYPGVVCGHIVSPEDAYMFAKINNGNAIAMPFGSVEDGSLDLEAIFENVCKLEWGSGYPEEDVEAQNWETSTLRKVKKITHHDMPYILDQLESDFLQVAISGQHFKEYFLADAAEGEIKSFIKSVI